jgi:hypothetical protein
MFGMLDYRAYKLYWLIGLPFRIVLRILFFIVIAIAIGIGHWTGYPILVQIVVAYIAMEIIAIVVGLVWTLLIVMPLEKIFFWLIDVVPSRGKDTEEAKDIVRSGPIIWLSKKLMNDIGNWTYEDTEAFVKCLNWRARIFFGEGEKFHNRVQILTLRFRRRLRAQDLAAGSSRSGSAWLGRSQKDGLPSRSRGVSWRLRLKAINSRTGEGQPGCCPFQIRRTWARSPSSSAMAAFAKSWRRE